MSRKRKEKIICSKCGTENEVEIWGSLNCDLDLSAKQQLLDGTLFDFKCKQCGHEGRVNYPMLYHDMTHKIMIHFVPEDSVEDVCMQFTKSEELSGIKLNGYTKRIVTNNKLLREKVIIFENKLDDRIIEIIKIIHFLHIRKQIPDANIEGIYFSISDGKYYLEFIGEKCFSTEVPLVTYEDAASRFAEKLNNEEAIVVVNLAWAHKFLNGE